MSKIFAISELYSEPLLSPQTVKQQLPTTSRLLEFVQQARQQVINVLNGKDNRLLLVIGPCSIHDLKSAKEYAANLKELAKAVSSTFLIVMRTYFEKPRTALGWKGMAYDPHLNGSYDFKTGITRARELLITLAEMQVPTATEFLDPLIASYTSDLISWACIGARTAESPVHRQFASSLPMAVGFKNNTLGNIEVATNAVLTASYPHAFFGVNDSGTMTAIHTEGNKNTHIVLRGGIDGPNYDEYSIGLALESLQRQHLPQRLLIDCSHDNSSRHHEKQRDVFESVIEQYVKGNHKIRGMALESHLFGGSQQIPLDISRLQYAVSITDPCLDWKSTNALIRWGAQVLENKEALRTPELATEGLCAKYT